MIRIGHLIDESAGWEERRAIGSLLDRLPQDRFAQSIASLDRSALGRLRESNQTGLCGELAIRKTAQAKACGSLALESLNIQNAASLGVTPNWRWVNPVVSAPRLRAWINRERLNIVHVWGVEAALAAVIAVRTDPRVKTTQVATTAQATTTMTAKEIINCRVVLELHNPALSKRSLNLLKLLTTTMPLTICCSAQIVRRRLTERGVPPESCVVVRPGVDFNLINRIRRGPLRPQLGLHSDDFVIFLPESISRCHAVFDAFLAGALLDQVSPTYRVIIPGHSSELHRIRRFAQALPNPESLVVPGNEHHFEELLAISDALIIPTTGDISSTSIAWAMAGGLVIVGSATHSVTEFIATKLNGLLYKPQRGKSPTLAISRLLGDKSTHAKIKETARGQAYEVFSLRRYVDQHIRLYDNLRSGKSVSDGITDPAMVG